MAFRMLRLLMVLGGCLVLTGVFAHGTERGLVLLLPTRFYLVGGTLAVTASFLLLAFIPARPVSRVLKWRSPGIALPGDISFWTSLGSTLFLFCLVAAGFLGSRDPAINPLPVFVWTLWWIVFFLLQAVVGNLWGLFNPWSAVAGLIRRFIGIGELPLRLPKSVAYWPAIFQFFGVAWFELVSISPVDPFVLGVCVLAYWVFNLFCLLVFGDKQWFERGEPFAVFFRLIGELAPIRTTCREGKKSLGLVFPGHGYLGLPALPFTGVLFVLLTLSSVSFDSLLRTFFWLAQIGINPLAFPGRSAVLMPNGVGLVLVFFTLSAVFFLVCWLGYRQTGGKVNFAEIAGRFIYSIIPVSIVFHFAHYLGVLLINGQYALLAFNDPFALGWNLFGISHYHVTASFFLHIESVRSIWTVQTVAITAGHIIGIVIAHGIAIEMFRQAHIAVRSQLYLALLMIGYTWFGLWLLSTASIG